MNWLRGYHDKKKISTITYIEFSMFLVIKKNKTFEHVDRLLRTCGIEVEPFNKKNAIGAVERMSEGDVYERCSLCNRLDWNDTMIASHAPIPPTLLVTDNLDDFIGLVGDWAVTPRDLMNNCRKFIVFSHQIKDLFMLFLTTSGNIHGLKAIGMTFSMTL